MCFLKGSKNHYKTEITKFLTIPIPTFHSFCSLFSFSLFNILAFSLFFFFPSTAFSNCDQIPALYLTVLPLWSVSNGLNLCFMISGLSVSFLHMFTVVLFKLLHFYQWCFFFLFIVGLWRSQGKTFLPNWQKPGVSREIHRKKIPSRWDA